MIRNIAMIIKRAKLVQGKRGYSVFAYFTSAILDMNGFHCIGFEGN